MSKKDKPQLYGFTNRILADITARIMSYPDLAKFLYYTDDKYKEENILILPSVKTSDIYDKKLYLYKRVPDVITTAGAYVYINIYRSTPTTIGGAINSTTFTVDILVHRECVTTAHGNRLVCIYTALNKALAQYNKSAVIGEVNLVRVAPILGVIKDFEGFSIQYECHGFKEDDFL